MSKDFQNLKDAGVQLAHILDARPVAVIALIGQGAEIAVAVASKFHVPVIPAIIQRAVDTHEVLNIDVAPCTTDGLMYVIDDAVETGHTTRAAWDALRASGYQNLTLAVPVSPRDTAAELMPLMGEIAAVKRPLIRRSLAWHYEEVPHTSADAALALISQHNRAISN